MRRVSERRIDRKRGEVEQAVLDLCCLRNCDPAADIASALADEKTERASWHGWIKNDIGDLPPGVPHVIAAERTGRPAEQARPLGLRHQQQARGLQPATGEADGAGPQDATLARG